MDEFGRTVLSILILGEKCSALESVIELENHVVYCSAVYADSMTRPCVLGVQVEDLLLVGAVLESTPPCLTASIARGRLFCPEPSAKVCNMRCKELGVCFDPSRAMERRRMYTQLLIRWHEWQRRYVQTAQLSLDVLGPPCIPGFVFPECEPVCVTPQKARPPLDTSVEVWNRILPSSSGPSILSSKRRIPSRSHNMVAAARRATPAEIASAERCTDTGTTFNSTFASVADRSVAATKQSELSFVPLNSAAARSPETHDHFERKADVLGSMDDNIISHYTKPAVGTANATPASTANVHLEFTGIRGDDDNGSEDDEDDDFLLVPRAKQAFASRGNRSDVCASLVEADMDTARQHPPIPVAGKRRRSEVSDTTARGLASKHGDLFSDEAGPESPEIG